MSYLTQTLRFFPGQASAAAAAAAAATPAVILDDFGAFELHPVIKDFKLTAELFASMGDIVLMCGKAAAEKGHNVLVSYEIPSKKSSVTAPIKLVKVQRLTKNTVTQLETVTAFNIALLLADGVVTLHDINTLGEIATVSTSSTVLFAYWYDPSIPNGPKELKIAVANKKHTVFFHRWTRNSKRVEPIPGNDGSIDLLGAPRAMGLSQRRLCIGYRKSYAIMDLEKGTILSEINFSTNQDPMTTCLKDRTQWCIQKDSSTVFLNSDFEPLYADGITWREVPTAIVRTSPYVLALFNQYIEICTFNESQGAVVQQLKYRTAPPSKPRLWMDGKNDRIYLGTSTDLFIIEPIPAQIQLRNYIGAYKFESAVVLVRGLLGLTDRKENEVYRSEDGTVRGNFDRSNLQVESIFSTEEFENIEDLKDRIDSNDDNASDESSLWVEFYRAGTMYAFQLFRLSKFERAFSLFDEHICDPTEIVCLFSTLSIQSWLPNFHKNFRNFLSKRSQFGEPNDFVGNRLEPALRDLQRFLTGLRRVFQNVYKNSNKATLEVFSLMKNKIILRPIHDLLTVVETSLLKVYLLNNNNTLVSALLRNEMNCCFPQEVERDLTKFELKNELILLYERQTRHEEALKGIVERDGPLSDSVLQYLKKLGKNEKELIFEKIKPFIEKSVQINDEKLLDRIMQLFVRGSLNEKNEFDPIEIFQFFKKFDEQISIKFLELICFRNENEEKNREIHNQLVRSYAELMKYFNEKSSKIKLNEITVKMKNFLSNDRCRCDLSKFEAFFTESNQIDGQENLFSLPLSVVFGKLGRHELALKTLTQSGNFTEAENYCENIYFTNNVKLAQELYTNLIHFYVGKFRQNESNEENFRPILRILNRIPERLDPVEILRILPENSKIFSIKDFLEFSLKNLMIKKRNSQLERNLFLVRLTRTQSKRIESENCSFVIDNGTRCAKTGCTQPFSATQAVVRFPNDQLVHFHCRTKYEDEKNFRK